VVITSVTGTEPESLVIRETLPAEPEPVTPVPSTKDAYDFSNNSSFAMDIEPESLVTRETSSVEPDSATPVPPTEEAYDLSSHGSEFLPLDLTVNHHKQLIQSTKLIRTEGQTPVIDCTTPIGA